MQMVEMRNNKKHWGLGCMCAQYMWILWSHLKYEFGNYILALFFLLTLKLRYVLLQVLIHEIWKAAELEERLSILPADKEHNF